MGRHGRLWERTAGRGGILTGTAVLGSPGERRPGTLGTLLGSRGLVLRVAPMLLREGGHTRQSPVKWSLVNMPRTAGLPFK